MKNLLTFLVLILTYVAQAQLYVQPTGTNPGDESYVFVDNTFLFVEEDVELQINPCLLYTSPSPRDRQKSRMPSSA